MHKEMLILKYSLLTVLSGVCDLWACSAQRNLLGISLAVAWKAKPVLIAIAQRSFQIVGDWAWAGSIVAPKLPSRRGKVCPVAGRTVSSRIGFYLVSRIADGILGQQP